MSFPPNDLLCGTDHFCRGLTEILGIKDTDEFITANRMVQNDPQTRGILIKAGRAGFYHWLRQNLETTGWNDPSFRFQPVKKKISSGLQSICLNLEKGTETHIKFENSSNIWNIEISGSIESLPCSYLWGFAQEFTRWAGIGRFYEVRESSCRLEGYSCCGLSIKKVPQD